MEKLGEEEQEIIKEKKRIKMLIYVAVGIFVVLIIGVLLAALF